MPQLYKSDYIVIAIAIFILIAALLSEGPVALVIITGVIAVCYGIYFVGRLTFRGIGAGKFDKFFEWAKKLTNEVLGWAIPIYFTVILFWFGFKVVASFFSWLKNGVWQFYDYQPACINLGFKCVPTTGFVKINEFLDWVYHFDVTIFLWAISIGAVLLIAWIIKATKDE